MSGAPVQRLHPMMWLVFAIALVAGSATQAGGVRSFAETAERLARGRADGVAVTTRGALFPAPRSVALGRDRLPGAPSQIWSMVADPAGNLFLGTGPDGHVIRVGPNGDAAIYFTAAEPLVTALAFDGDGSLLAGTSPGGKIYRVRGSTQAAVWSETGERYVWSLLVLADGTVFAGTGERGALLRVAPSGRAEPFFDSAEAHLVSLAAAGDGALLAGGADRGLVYRVTREGHGLVLHGDDLPQAAALVSDGDGGAIAAFVAPPPPEVEAPAVRLRLPDGARVGTSNENVGSLEEYSGPVLRGTIEGLPPRLPEAVAPLRGRIVRIGDDGRVAELWRSTTEAPFALLRDESGRVLVGTGEPARIYRIESDGDIALLATHDDAQVTALLRAGRTVHFGTSNPAAVYRMASGPAENGIYESEPIDAGSQARWGAVRWRSTGATRGEVYTRTGSSRHPDATWSGWGPAMTDGAAGEVAHLDGRYLQWRARFPGGAGDSGRIHDLTVLYEPYNRPPAGRRVTIDDADGAVSGRLGIAWSALDPDGDALEARVEYRPAATATAWTLAATRRDATGRSGWNDERIDWDTSAVAEGDYDLRVVLSDAASNTAEEAATVVVEPSLRVTIDRTPPQVSVAAISDGTLSVDVRDAHSPIARAVVVADGVEVQTLRPVDGLADSRVERFIYRPSDGITGSQLRVEDAAGNRTEIPLEAP